MQKSHTPDGNQIGILLSGRGAGLIGTGGQVFTEEFVRNNRQNDHDSPDKAVADFRKNRRFLMAVPAGNPDIANNPA